jgi:Secretion system C-terminal sorting domain
MKKFYSSSCVFSFLFFICTSAGISQAPTSQTFNASGTYTINPGYSAVVTIEAWGGGGGGSSLAGAAGGGGGGAYASITTTLTANSYTVTVGAGGGVGVAGSNSSFTTLVIAVGGSSTPSGAGGPGGTAAASTGLIKFSGGTGGGAASGGGPDGGGGGGGSATPTADGGNGGNGLSNPSNNGGAGGTGTGAGGSGANGTAGVPDATAGTAPGGGGGGRGSGGGTSKAGADGRVIVTVNSVLPVRLKTFKAIKKATSVELEWNSESESNLADYIIEKSTNGINFSAINTVAARNSSNSEIYNYTDAVGNANTIYYRIAMTELDGKITFSRIVKVVSTGKGTQLQVYPNPVRGGVVNFITPELAKGVYSVEVFNSTAQVVYKVRYNHTGGALSQSIQLPESLKPGIYSIHIKDGQVKYQHNFLIQ